MHLSWSVLSHHEPCPSLQNQTLGNETVLPSGDPPRLATGNESHMTTSLSVFTAFQTQNQFKTGS